MSASDNKHQSNYSPSALLLEISMQADEKPEALIKKELAGLVAEIDKEYSRLSAASTRELCSSIRYEAALELRGLEFVARRIHKLAAKHGATDVDPFELCKCCGCKKEYEFRYLESNGGYCDSCTE